MSKKRDKFTQGFHLVNGVYDDVEFDVVFCFVTDELFLYFFFYVYANIHDHFVV